MNKKAAVKMCIDLVMTAALPVLMCYSIVGETAHEVIGVAMFCLFIAHHILNFGWIRSLFKGRYTLSGKEEQTFWRRIEIKFSCPVNVEVVDTQSQKVVGYVRDGVVYSDGSIDIDLSYDMKTVTLPKEHTYTLRLTGTDDGTMQILYKDIENEQELAYTAFYDVPLTEGIIYTQELNTTEMPAKINDFPALTSNSGTIKASKYYTADDMMRYVEVMIEDAEGGMTSGDGEYTRGDSVLVSAIPEDGYTFSGWYEDGVLVGNQASMRFPVMTNHLLSPRFDRELQTFSKADWIIQDAYTGDARFWNYEDDDTLLVEMSIYTSVSEPKAILIYKNGTEQKIELESEDKVHYVMNDIKLKDLNTITVLDVNDKEIAIMELPDGLLGDINSDSIINAKDASEVLIAAAKIGTGNPSGLTPELEALADVNSDGAINAKDANTILRYAAAVGTGVKAKITDYI